MITLIIFFIFSIFLILLSNIFKKIVVKIKKENKIQLGKITYSDIHKFEKPLFSSKYLIIGKPDYVVEKKDFKIPVELKTGYYNSPKINHIYQLAAYCHLIEENYGTFVPYGILVYNNSSNYNIPFNPRVRFELENIIKNMRYSIKTKNILRNHDDKKKCINCSMRENCNNVLT